MELCAQYMVHTTPSCVEISLLEAICAFQVVMAILPKTEQIVFLQINGRIHEDHVSKVIDMGMKGCRDVHSVLDTTVRHYIADTMATMGE